MSKYCHYSFLLLLVICSMKCHQIFGADPTDGFTEVALAEENFILQKPYNEPLGTRYSYKDGVRSFWVYNHDKPFKSSSGTRPRTEVRIKGHDYSSGIWQFEGYACVPKGTSGVTIMQIHGASEGATTLQLRIYNGDMKYYKFNVVATDLYDKWFRLNVIHDVGKGKITVFIDGEQKFVVNDQGPGDLYFKCTCRLEQLHGLKMERYQTLQEIITNGCKSCYFSSKLAIHIILYEELSTMYTRIVAV